LRFNDGGNGPLVVADLDGKFNGSDGASARDSDGLKLIEEKTDDGSI